MFLVKINLIYIQNLGFFPAKSDFPPWKFQIKSGESRTVNWKRQMNCCVHWDHSSQNASGTKPTFTSERLCWRPPHRPSASRNAPPAAPPSCWPWPPGARGCPESQTCLWCRSFSNNQGNKYKRKEIREKSSRKKNLYRTEGAAKVRAGFSSDIGTNVNSKNRWAPPEGTFIL